MLTDLKTRWGALFLALAIIGLISVWVGGRPHLGAEPIADQRAMEAGNFSEASPLVAPDAPSPTSPGEGDRSEVEELIHLSIRGGRSGEAILDGLAAIWCDGVAVSAVEYTGGELSVPSGATAVLVTSEDHVPVVLERPSTGVVELEPAGHLSISAVDESGVPVPNVPIGFPVGPSVELDPTIDLVRLSSIITSPPSQFDGAEAFVDALRDPTLGLGDVSTMELVHVLGRLVATPRATTDRFGFAGLLSRPEGSSTIHVGGGFVVSSCTGDDASPLRSIKTFRSDMHSTVPQRVEWARRTDVRIVVLWPAQLRVHLPPELLVGSAEASLIHSDLAFDSPAAPQAHLNYRETKEPFNQAGVAVFGSVWPGKKTVRVAFFDSQGSTLRFLEWSGELRSGDVEEAELEAPYDTTLRARVDVTLPDGTPVETSEVFSDTDLVLFDLAGGGRGLPGPKMLQRVLLPLPSSGEMEFSGMVPGEYLFTVKLESLRPGFRAIKASELKLIDISVGELTEVSFRLTVQRSE